VDINSSLLGQAITFALLVWFTMKFVWPPLTHKMDERAARIADGLAAADRAKLDLELAGKQSTEKLREAKVHSAQIIAQAEKRAAQIVEDAKQQAKTEAERLVIAAKADIAQEIFRTKEALRQQVSSLVVLGAEQILRREVDANQHTELLATLKAEL
jgi:F-type H+-transporting ATPase subunit b